jgi:hypothetical protein
VSRSGGSSACCRRLWGRERANIGFGCWSSGSRVCSSAAILPSFYEALFVTLTSATSIMSCKQTEQSYLVVSYTENLNSSDSRASLCSTLHVPCPSTLVLVRLT